MPNDIKRHRETMRLQLTRSVRAAGLVEETGEGEDRRTTYRANVRVHSFDGLVAIGDLELPDPMWAAIVQRAADYTDSSYQATDALVQHDGHGYSIAIPPAKDAGFDIGDTPGVHTAPKLIVLTTDDTSKVGRELTNFRSDQATHGTVDGIEQ